MSCLWCMAWPVSHRRPRHVAVLNAHRLLLIIVIYVVQKDGWDLGIEGLRDSAVLRVLFRDKAVLCPVDIDPSVPVTILSVSAIPEGAPVCEVVILLFHLIPLASPAQIRLCHRRRVLRTGSSSSLQFR